MGPVKPFKAIAAMSLNRVIGSGNKIPWHLPEDFKWFKKMTTGQVIVMGRKTFESIGKPLPNRTTIVLTRAIAEESEVRPGQHSSAMVAPQAPNQTSGGTVLKISDLRQLTSVAGQFAGREIYICGGAQVYQQALPLCSDLYLTLVKRNVQGDTFFPAFEDRFDLAKELLDTPEFKILHYRQHANGHT